MKHTGIVLAAVLVIIGGVIAYMHAHPRPPRDEVLPDGVQGVTRPPALATGTMLVLRSPAVDNGGQLPVDYTGDGSAATLPLEWTGVPAGTRSLAVIMHHIPGPGDVKWYWVLYNIPAKVTSLPRNVTGLGTLGNNSINGRTEYAPPHSKGPGPKLYVYTVYALSAPPPVIVQPAEVSRAVLLDAMKGLVLDSAELHVVYTRQSLQDGEAK